MKNTLKVAIVISCLAIIYIVILETNYFIYGDGNLYEHKLGVDLFGIVFGIPTILYFLTLLKNITIKGNSGHIVKLSFIIMIIFLIDKLMIAANFTVGTSRLLGASDFVGVVYTAKSAPGSSYALVLSIVIFILSFILKKMDNPKQ
jgi:hypothetical protein